MKTSCLALLLFIFTQLVAVGQNLPTDSLKRMLSQTHQDTSRVLLLAQIANNYRFFDSDSSMVLAQQAMRLAERLNFPKGKAQALTVFGETRRFRGEFPQALEAHFKALQLSKNSHYLGGEETSLGGIGFVYLELNEYRRALDYLFEAEKLNQSRSDKYVGSRWLSGIGLVYEKLNRLDSALYFQQQAHAFLSLFPPSYIGSVVLIRLGILQSKLGHPELAIRYFQEAITASYLTHDIVNLSKTQYQLAQLYHTIHQPDSSLHYGRLAFTNGERISLRATILDASNLLVTLYEERKNLDSAFYYQTVAMATKDSLYGREKFQQLQVLTLHEQQRQQALIAAQTAYQTKIRLYGLLGGLAMLLVVAVILWLNNQQKQKAKTLLQLQRDQTDQAFAELKATQTQLIQKEKMASLGELTAGIAHEIQNPLNFVNNFSEVSGELVGELKEGPFQKLPDPEKEYANEILGDLTQNLQKITHHGQRASSIVKGMLEHSRTSTGERQSTDLNALADEYLRLSYQGLRAKNQAFNCELVTDFDPNVGVVEVVPQDIGRVLLNLFNNAFYAVREKQKAAPPAYQPSVSVSTRLTTNQVAIHVKDNGTGMSNLVKQKLFQPFFTTKPPGEGIGLGLSLSYDIVTKGHQGSLRVENQDGEGTEFIIQLPTAKVSSLA